MNTFRYRLCLGCIFLIFLNLNLSYKIYETGKKDDYKPTILHTKESNILAKTKILLYITTHMSKAHMWFFQNCWPVAMRNSFLLNTSDVTIYLNRGEKNKTTSIKLLQNVFNGRNFTIHFQNETKQFHSIDPVKNANISSYFHQLSNYSINSVDDISKQMGAIKAIEDAYNDGLFTKYDWVIRLNPDVIIRNETPILNYILNDPGAAAILVDCWEYRRKTNPILPKLIHTDFFALKTGVLSKDIFKKKFGLYNAEATFTMQIENEILKTGRHRWLESSTPLSGNCRVGDRRNLDSVPVTHFHPLLRTMKSNSCPVKF